MLVKNDKNRLTYKNKISVLCFTLIVLLIVSCTAISCFAEDKSAVQTYPFSSSGNTVQKTYMLVVCTGTSADSDEIGYFEIQYVDTNGKSCSEFLTPQGARQYAFDCAKTANNTETKEAAAKKAMKTKFGANAIVKGDTKPMKKASTEYLAFTLPVDMKSFTGINFYCVNSTSSTKKWPCSSLKLYKVNKIYGGMYNNDIGGDYSVVFDGTLMAKYAETSGYNFSWSKNQVISLSENASKKENQLIVSGFTSAEQNFSNVEDRYYVEIDIADFYGAGLESFAYEYGVQSYKWTDLNAYCIDNLYLYEAMFMKITYKDSNGMERIVSVPMVSAYYKLLNEIYYDCTKKWQNEGIWQAGNTVDFQVFLNDMESITKIDIEYSDKNSLYTDTFKSKKNMERIHTLDDTEFSFTALRVVRANSSVIKYSHNDGTRPIATIQGTTNVMYTYIASSRTGTKISKDSSLKIIPKKYKTGNKTEVGMGTNTYLVTLETDSASSAGTYSTVYIKFKYKNKNGQIRETEEFDILKLSMDYYGVWPIYMEKDEIEWYKFSNEYIESVSYYYASVDIPIAYAMYMSNGGTINFVVNISNVKSFVGATVRLGGSDEWQMKSISIKQLSSLSQRQIDFCSASSGKKIYLLGRGIITNSSYEDLDFLNTYYHKTLGELPSTVKTEMSNYITTATSKTAGKTFQTTANSISRTYTGVDCAKYNTSVLLQNKGSASFEFSSKEVSEIDVNWSDYTHSMTYDETKNYLGFEKSRCIYTVNVQVGKSVDSETENGDCGSKNQFYFQLVFENGNSGYVLANQQLSSDGFRTGVKESFTISTNRDYGELTSIHIIPENPNSQEDVYDKLNIDYIEVTKAEESGLNRKWTVEIEDWISIKYVDVATQDSIEGQTPSTESDLAQVFMVTSEGYDVSLLFTVKTSSTSQTAKAGMLTAVIEYIDEEGYTKTKDVDVGKSIAEYSNISYDNYTYDSKTYGKINTSWFLIANKTDRFNVTIGDLASLSSITFYGVADEAYDWVVENVGVYVVGSVGKRILNANNEIEKSETKQQLTSTDTTATFTLNHIAKTKCTTGAINFDENDFTIYNSSGSTNAQITYYPQNANDTLNIYVYMDKKGSPLSQYDMDSNISYNVDTEKLSNGTTLSGAIKAKAVSLKADEKNMLFYATGVNVSGYTGINSITLKADSSSTYCDARVSHVIVETLRSGVIISTKKLIFLQTNATYSSCIGTPEINSTDKNTYKQYVCFQLSDETKAALLSNKTDDIAVSFTYTSVNGATNQTINTPNQFLSECGVSQIVPGGEYCVTYEIPNCASITKLNFTAMGELIKNVSIKNAYVATCTYDEDDNGGCNGWYSFADSTPMLKASTRSMMLTSDMNDTSNNNTNVACLTFTIKTAARSENIESGTSCPVNMVIGYTDNFGDADTAVVYDIASIAKSGSTKTDDTMQVVVLVNGFKSIRSIELEPVSNNPNTDTTWKVESVDFICEVNGIWDVGSRAVNAVAQEGKPLTVNLCRVILEANVFSENEKDGTSFNEVAYDTDEEPIGFEIEKGREVTITPTITGSASGIEFKCYRVTNGVASLNTTAYKAAGTTDTVRSVVFKTDTSGQYKLVFSSKEFPNVTTTFYITVEEDVSPATQAADDATTGTTEEETTVDATEDESTADTTQTETTT